MQHHVHARQTTHIRAAHHHNHMPLHGSMQQDQHMGGLPATTAAGAALGGAQQQPQREHHLTRLNHHHHQQHHHTQQANAANTYQQNTNQMHKIRQQHQHLSPSNGHVKCNQPPPQTYNHPASNAGALSYSQLAPHMAHLGGYAAQPQPYYMTQGKPSKYNNNNSSHYNANNSNYTHAPKTILQNTYRNAKTNGQSQTPVPAEADLSAAATTTNSNNIVIATEGNAVDEGAVVPLPGEADDASSAASPTDDASSTEHVDAAGNLSNDDGSPGRNSKDKTPMCLVNELARYNKITHQYRLTGERGPAHCKTFTVTLKLGEEEYSADGFKIKKAQHLAASKAIEETKYKHPPPKIRRNEEVNNTRTHITPTVELNALAMKLGQRTYYLLDPTQTTPPNDAMMASDYGGPLLPTPNALQPPLPPPPHVPYTMRRNGNYVLSAPPMHAHVALPPPRGIYGHQRAYAPKYPARYALPPQLGGHMLHGPFASLPVTPSKITLFVGKQKFVGIGRTLQQAKHDAAARALQVLKTQASSAAEEALDDSLDEGDKKSPISQVHEIGIKRNMTVHFKVLREEGPAHMKNFITACIVGTIVTEGEGNGKKVSKKRAAEKMVTELQKLPPITPTKQTLMKRIKVKTPAKNSAAVAATTATGATVAAGALTPASKGERRKRVGAPIREKPAELDDEENPITKLIQLQQNRKEKEPVFELVAKNGNDTSRRREFVIEVSANGSTARGIGNSKKTAKRNAAQALLELFEFEEHSEEMEEATDDITTTTAAAAAEAVPLPMQPMANIEPTVGLDVPMVSTPAGPVPGILILRQNKKPAKKKEAVAAGAVVKTSVEATKEETKTETKTTMEQSTNESLESDAAAESALNSSTGSNSSGISSNSSNGPTTTTTTNNNSSGTTSVVGVHMKTQLLYLSKLLEFEVNFSDYPKGNHNEFLTIVTLSTEPPQICHGVGKSADESQNDAARNALKILSELGLSNAKK